MKAWEALHRIIRIFFSDLVRSEFPGGIIPSSIIDRKKFAKLFQESFPFPFPVNYEDEQSITALCQTECIPAGKKYYAIAKKAKAELTKILDDLAASGRNAIYYENLYKSHAHVLFNLGIGSPLILAGCIKKLFSYKCADEYFCFNDSETVAIEAMRVLKDEIQLTPATFAKYLPFIPWEIAHKALLATGEFLPQKNDLLIRKSSIEFDEAELEKAFAETRKQIAETGYMPIKSVNLSQTQMANLDMPAEAIMTAFIDQLAPEGYEKRGPYIRKSNSESIAKMITSFCEQAEHFTYSELKDRFNVDTSKLPQLPWYAQRSAFQIDQENFVNKNSIKMDWLAIDRTLSELKDDNPFTLLSFSDFSLLPPIANFTWNHYLLQSFFIHASTYFCYKQPAHNNSCIAIIYKKGLFNNLNYTALAAKIALNDFVVPEFNTVSEYIIKKGIYSQKRSYAINNLVTAIQSCC